MLGGSDLVWTMSTSGVTFLALTLRVFSQVDEGKSSVARGSQAPPGMAEVSEEDLQAAEEVRTRRSLDSLKK